MIVTSYRDTEMEIIVNKTRPEVIDKFLNELMKHLSKYIYNIHDSSYLSLIYV